jgi:hypothetical protein
MTKLSERGADVVPTSTERRFSRRTFFWTLAGLGAAVATAGVSIATNRRPESGDGLPGPGGQALGGNLIQQGDLLRRVDPAEVAKLLQVPASQVSTVPISFERGSGTADVARWRNDGGLSLTMSVSEVPGDTTIEEQLIADAQRSGSAPSSERLADTVGPFGSSPTYFHPAQGQLLIYGPNHVVGMLLTVNGPNDEIIDIPDARAELQAFAQTTGAAFA